MPPGRKPSHFGPSQPIQPEQPIQAPRNLYQPAQPKGAGKVTTLEILPDIRENAFNSSTWECAYEYSGYCTLMIKDRQFATLRVAKYFD